MNGVLELFRWIHRDKSGVTAASVTFAGCALISLIGWIPLSLPSRLISSVLPQVTCTGVRTGTPAMYFCSAGVALLTVIGPVLTILLLYLLRTPLAKWLGYAALKLPEEMHFLLAPVLATVLFTVAWSGVHFDTAAQVGFLPQTIFPAVVGLFTFVIARYGGDLQRVLSPFFDYRDKFPKWMRVLVAIAVPLVLSLVITLQDRVSQETLKEQVIVLISLCTGYLALAPRHGDFLSGVQQMEPEEQYTT